MGSLKEARVGSGYVAGVWRAGTAELYRGHMSGVPPCVSNFRLPIKQAVAVVKLALRVMACGQDLDNGSVLIPIFEDTRWLSGFGVLDDRIA